VYVCGINGGYTTDGYGILMKEKLEQESRTPDSVKPT
jgi:hypothetical protein